MNNYQFATMKASICLPKFYKRFFLLLFFLIINCEKEDKIALDLRIAAAALIQRPADNSTAEERSKLPHKTGQIIQYRIGDDGTFLRGRERSYTDNGNGTIRDNVSELIWQKCSHGQTNDSGCTGTLTRVDWSASNNYCNSLSLASLSWRLPTIEELQYLPDYGKGNGTNLSIDLDYFPNTDNDFDYASSTEKRDNSVDEIYSLNFRSGRSSIGFKSNVTNTRCVSGSKSTTKPALRNLGDGTAVDENTNLVWAICSAGLVGSSCLGTETLFEWEAAVSYCRRSFNLAGREWRLPNLNEMKTILDRTRPTGTPFPNSVATRRYWTSTSSLTNGTNNAWEVYFDNGNPMFQTRNKSNSNSVHCVSGP